LTSWPTVSSWDTGRQIMEVNLPCLQNAARQIYQINYWNKKLRMTAEDTIIQLRPERYNKQTSSWWYDVIFLNRSIYVCSLPFSRFRIQNSTAHILESPVINNINSTTYLHFLHRHSLRLTVLKVLISKPWQFSGILNFSGHSLSHTHRVSDLNPNRKYFYIILLLCLLTTGFINLCSMSSGLIHSANNISGWETKEHQGQDLSKIEKNVFRSSFPFSRR
jgi:hypothetical protein